MNEAIPDLQSGYAGSTPFHSLCIVWDCFTIVRNDGGEVMFQPYLQKNNERNKTPVIPNLFREPTGQVDTMLYTFMMYTFMMGC